MLLKKNLATNFTIQLKSIDKKSLSFYTHFLKKVFYKTSVVYSHTSLPIRKKRITLLKSPHVNKKAREQFETRVFKAIINIKLFVPLKKESIFIIFYLFKQFIKQSNFTSLIKSKIKLWINFLN